MEISRSLLIAVFFVRQQYEYDLQVQTKNDYCS